MGKTSFVDTIPGRMLIGFLAALFPALFAFGATFWATSITSPMKKIDDAIEVMRADHAILKMADQTTLSALSVLEQKFSSHERIDDRREITQESRLTALSAKLEALIAEVSKVNSSVGIIGSRQKINEDRIQTLENNRGHRN